MRNQSQVRRRFFGAGRRGHPSRAGAARGRTAERRRWRRAPGGRGRRGAVGGGAVRRRRRCRATGLVRRGRVRRRRRRCGWRAGGRVGGSGSPNRAGPDPAPAPVGCRRRWGSRGRPCRRGYRWRQALPAAFPRKRERSTTTRVMRPGGDEPVAVLHRDPEREPAALDRLEDGLGVHLVADRDRREVVELDPVADGRLALPRAGRATASTVARSARSTTRGVASTGTSPLPSASAVSLVARRSSDADPTSPGSRHGRTIRTPRGRQHFGGCP